MTKTDSITPWKQDDAASRRAADFFARRRRGEWSDADQAELDVWLAESTLHYVAYLRVESAFAHTEHLYAFDPRAFGEEGGQGHFSRFAVSHILRRRFLLPFLAAASLAAAAFWGAPFAASLMASWFAPPDRTDSTDVGGRTLLSFADHTEIELNTATAVRVRMTNKERTVWLEKGEAWFQVAHDAAHPFTVIVGTHRVTDLGTEFLIRRDGDAVDVTLLNGRATVASEGLQTATLIPGEEAVATPATLSVTRKTPQELADALAWRRGMLVFRETPLSDVVREFDRYNATKLVIADPSIADETISADLRTDAFEDFLGLVEVRMNLHVDREGSVIRISRGLLRDETKKAKRAAQIKRGR